MWNDPEYSLAAAREHQRDILRAVEALRTNAPPSPPFDEVVASWADAVRVTGAYLRGSRRVRCDR